MLISCLHPCTYVHTLKHALYIWWCIIQWSYWRGKNCWLMPSDGGTCQETGNREKIVSCCCLPILIRAQLPGWGRAQSWKMCLSLNWWCHLQACQCAINFDHVTMYHQKQGSRAKWPVASLNVSKSMIQAQMLRACYARLQCLLLCWMWMGRERKRRGNLCYFL